MKSRPDLARKITVSLVLYGILLSAALFVHGLMVNEVAERMVWKAMLGITLDDLLERRAENENVEWRNNGRLDLYRLDAAGAPESLRQLPVGLHDEVQFNGRQWAILVRDVDGERLALALDIEGFEETETRLLLPVIGFSALLLLLMSVVIHFGARALVRPLRDMARNIGALLPDRRGQQVALPARASRELEVIAGALNDYLQRNDRFVERERSFIDTASHELRTPVAVIRSAAQLGRAAPGLPQAAAGQLERIIQTTGEVEELVSMLLVLAKDPARMRHHDERVALDELLPAIVADHQPLCEGRELELQLGDMVACTLSASEAVLRVAIGNLLRNAIENSDQGVIRIDLHAPAMVRISDPGHGMSAEQISALYTRMAQGGSRRAGIGMDLIARLGEHLGWTLRIEPNEPRGTRVCLDLSNVRVD